MAYTPINWQTGDTITAAKLNKCDNGWSVETSSTELYSGSLTVSSNGGDVTIPSNIAETLTNTAELIISIDGTSYTCVGFDDDGLWTFGAPYEDYSTYPFSVYVDGLQSKFTHQTAGTYTLKIETTSETVETSSNFQAAIAAANVLQVTDPGGTLDTTFADIEAAYLQGKTVLINDQLNHIVKTVYGISGLTIYVRNADYTASSGNDYPSRQ